MSSLKGYLWSVTFLLTAAIYGSIPTYLIVSYWRWLNALTFNGEPIYTLTLFMLFLWIVSLIITLIYLVAMIRAIVQRKNEDLGIPKGVSYFGLITDIVLVAFMIVWYLIFNQVAFFSMVSPI
ncbi:MAG: hypothetical protein EU533_08870 [Promethearchaeota archaeon]|nr:MAG: hypothetical protein EU533_08870 [Candidatus Lokiarchaeota archaeon]